MEAAPPGQLNARQVVWAERLGALDAAWLAVRAAGAEVRYDEKKSTHAGLRLAARFGFRPANLTLARVDETGFPLNDRREAALEEAVAAFARERLAGGPSRFISAFTAYFAGKLHGRVTFLTMAESAAKSLPGRGHRFYVSRQPANVLLARTFDLALIQSPLPFEGLRQTAAPIVLLLRAIAAGLLGTTPRNDLTGKPSVWAEYYPVDILGRVSRVFWKDFVDPDKWDRVFYIDRSDTPCDDDVVRLIEGFGMRWIDATRPWALAGLGLGEALPLLRALVRPGQPWWVRVFGLYYEVTAAVWAAVFRRFRVRLLMQHQELSWLPVVQAEALERAGGLMFGVHWSDFPFLTETTHQTPEHVFFVWGATNKRWLEGKGHGCRHILPSGLWLPSDAGESARLRARLGPAEFSLAVFDSSYAYDIFYSAEMLSSFLNEILSVLEERPGWKVLFKPKSPVAYGGLPGGADLMRRLHALESAGQALLLEPFVSPIDAALAVDLAVCFGFNSAGVVAGARGARAIHWNAAGWVRHPLRLDPRQKILYDDLAAVRRAILAAPADTSIGDFSRWRLLADHYGDRRAAERVGGWISDQLATSERLGDPGAAADETVARYRARHPVNPDFDLPGDWWRS